MAETVLEALRAMRPPFTLYEADIHRLIGERLSDAGLAYRHEAILGRGCRIDYLIGDVGVEIKKGKPRPALIEAQLRRYAESERIESLVLVSWGSVRLPAAIHGKPVYGIVLSQLWGVSLP